MIIKRYLTTASMVCTMAIGLSGSAFAATGSDVTMTETGPDSVNKVEINNSTSTNISNDNNVHALNLNVQSAKTGAVKAEDITTVNGGIGSGDASNVNATDTNVNISNGGHEAVTPGSGNGGGITTEGGNGGGAGVTPGSGGGSAPGVFAPGMGAGGGVLPEVGAKFPVDVSALRAAWNNQAAPDKTLAKASSLFTNAMLLTAALLSLLGAAGSAWWTKRRQERI